jgi:hypothetical protein
MHDNPYRPPTADVFLPVVPQELRKPKSAWVLQIVAAVLCAGLVLGIVRTGIIVSAGGPPGQGLGGPLFGLAWRLAALVGAMFAIRGTHRAAPYGRFLGLIMIAVLFASAIYQSVRAKTYASSHTEYSNLEAGAAGEIIGAMLVATALAYWFYAFGFSAKARRYFGVGREERVQ